MPDAPDSRLPRIPADWTVWAFTDPHGVTSALVTALQEAGILDQAQHWVAPPKTALVGCGDYLDRGGDVCGLVALLRRLELEAPAHDSAVFLARGNHEVMPLMVRDGADEWFETWLGYGGDATLAAYGCHDEDAAEPRRMAATIESRAPGLFDWLESLAQAVRWRDVLFVHGGLAPGHRLEDLGDTTEEHLWIRAGFFDAAWDSEAFAAYRAAGIERVVFGHTPQPDGPTSFHGGHSLAIDTNAVGNPRLPADAAQQLTLLGLVGDGSFEDTRFIAVPTRDAPDTMRR